ncbi:DeoR/GlpR family DNA-binding transcription regulator [Devriesea agamarum]|uniref:DeoR/GlpR family DNA-binding transcription regulator n=1 Tax=Devriesea agamarum TaxID=472569 RepID=UPI00071CB28B|nr:DeoR/GlpR family DNA-binding transcription regulator [Devriesea agamarum]
MFAEERHARILTELTRHGTVTVSGLSESFNVNSETIRRDLAQLARAGQLRRVHGGAVALGVTAGDEPSLATRISAHSHEKQRIGEAAAREIARLKVRSVALDAGSTTVCLGQALLSTPSPRDLPWHIVTHSLTVASVLAPHQQAVVDLVGGRVRPLTEAAVGAATCSAYELMRPDIAVLGANGLSAGFGLSTPDPHEADVKRALAQAGQTVMALVDSSKFGVETLAHIISLDQLDILICDAEPPSDLAEELAAHDVQVVLA